MYLITTILIIVITLCLLLLGLILFNVKMNIYESYFDGFITPPDSPISYNIDELLSGGLRAPLKITNWFRTCFIDSVLNSIANSETLTKHFKDILPESKVSDEQIQNAFINGIPEKKIISSLIEKDMTTQNNKLTIYKILCSIFIRGIDNNYSKDVLIYITLYIMYLENSTRFNDEAGAPIKEMDPTENFYTYVQNTDYNFVMYFIYCDKMIKKNINPAYTGVSNNLLITKLGLKHIFCICDYSEIQRQLNTNTDSDLFIETIYIPTVYDEIVVKAMFDICITKYKGKYRCTDIILDEYRKKSDISYHSVYYNIDKELLHNNSVITKTSKDIISKPLTNGNYYIPRILHFQQFNQ